MADITVQIDRIVTGDVGATATLDCTTGFTPTVVYFHETDNPANTHTLAYCHDNSGSDICNATATIGVLKASGWVLDPDPCP